MGRFKAKRGRARFYIAARLARVSSWGSYQNAGEGYAVTDFRYSTGLVSSPIQRASRASVILNCAACTFTPLGAPGRV